MLRSGSRGRRPAHGQCRTGHAFRVEIDVERHQIQPTGELDMATAPKLLDTIGPLTAGEVVTFDLSQVSFRDAAALNTIVSIRNNLALIGATLTVAGVRPRQARVFLIAGLASLLPHMADG